jgi:hypothetical protein
MNEQKKFYDKVFNANSRTNSEGWEALAKYLTVEQLEKLADKE